MSLRPLPQVLGATDLRARGVGRDELRRLLRSGRVVAVARGLWADAAAWSSAPAGDQLASRSLALQRNYHPDKVLCGLSAAAVHRFALPLRFDGIASMCTDDPGVRARCSADLVVHRTRLQPADTVPLGGLAMTSGGALRVTSPARTVADCARRLPLGDGLALADSAARGDSALPAALADTLGHQPRWLGAPRARAAYRLLDGRRESWLESASFARFAEAGLPLPEPQVELYDAQGRVRGRVDMLWHEYGVVGEADGRGKYVEGGLQALLEEKQRGDRIRDLGLEVVRWDVADLLNRFSDVLDRLAAARRRGSAHRFSGQWASTGPARTSGPGVRHTVLAVSSAGTPGTRGSPWSEGQSVAVRPASKALLAVTRCPW